MADDAYPDGYVIPRTGPDAGKKRSKTPPQRRAPGGTMQGDESPTSVDDAVDRMSGDGQGQRQNQSTDAQNQY